MGTEINVLKSEALFFVLQFWDYLWVCVIFIQNDCCPEFYCIVTLEDDVTFCVEMFPGCLYLHMKWREAKRRMWLMW